MGATLHLIIRLGTADGAGGELACSAASAACSDTIASIPLSFAYVHPGLKWRVR